ncbi:hypothetical protein HK099_001689 [Clydaea vesicula]|uniref:adenylate cyclase n=1 Tax=Clydaea vesicula TaxID=447962 RepID=A0AAD5U4X7_9FUNG|nr:hypothetical protein HK099_001689 [Clydaea vesicula]
MFKNLNERRMSSLPVLSITTDPQVVINVTESSNHNLSSTERENTSGFSLVINKIKGKFNNQSGSNRSSFSPSYAKSSNDIIKHSQSSSDVAGFSVLQTSNQELHQTPTGFRSTTSNRNISSISQFILSNQNNELPELKLSKVNRSASFLMSNKQSLFCDVYDVDQIHPQKIDNNLGSGNSLENGIQAAVENLTGLVAHSQYSGRDLLSRETMGDSSPKQFEELPTQLKDEERDIAEHSSINQNNGVEVNAVVTSIEKEENNESTFEKVAKKQPGRRKSSVDTTNVKEFGEKEEGYSHRRRAISDFSSKETSSKKYFSITTPPISKMLHSSHSSHSQNQENSPVSSININSRLNSRIESLGKSKSISSEKITSPTALLPKTPTPMNPRVKRDSSSEKRVSIKERRVSISQKRHSSMHTESISNMLENRIKNSISEDDAKKYIDEMENKIKKSENGESDRNQKSIDEGSKVIHESGNEYQFSRMSTSSKNNLKTVNNEDEKLFHSVFLKFSTENEALYNKYIFNLLIKNTYKRNFYIFATFWFLYCGFEFYQLRYGFPKGSTLIFELTNYITEVLILLFSLILIVTSYFETFYERFYQILNTLSIILITFQGISAALRTQSLDSHQTEYVSWFGFSYLFLIYMSFPSSFIQLSFFGSFLMVFYVVFLFSLGNYRETASLSSIVGSSLLLLAANFLGIYYRFTAELQLREGFLKYENQCICAGRLKNTQIQSEYLLSMILPRKTIEILGRRKSKSNRTHSSLQDTFVELHGVTVLFADIIGFTEFSSTVSTSQLISILSEIFAEFDTMATELDLEKIKTIGDCYEVAGGLPDQANEEQIKIYAEKVCFMAFFMIKAVAMISRKLGYNLHLRVGIHTGTVTAGVIGIWKFKYDIWSNDVETANLMEQTGKNSVPHISASTYELLKTSTTLKFLLSEKVEAFGKQIQTYDVSTSQKTNYATLAELRRAFLQQLVKEEVDPSIIEIPQNDEESENFEINKKMKKFSNEINKLTSKFSMIFKLFLTKNYFLKIENDFAAKKIRKAQIATNNLLLNILPQNVVDLLKQNPTLQIAMDLNEVGILFCSICNFENVVQKNAIWLLNDIICDMDEICLEFGVEKIKTIGTKYLVMSEPNSNFASDHITRLVSFALDLQDYIKEFNSKTNQNFELKIGIHAGEKRKNLDYLLNSFFIGCVAAGVIGTKSFSYDVWGDTVNVASRMESTGRNDHIHITEKIYHHLKTLSGLRFEDRGMIYVKGKGELQTYFLFPKQPDE